MSELLAIDFVTEPDCIGLGRMIVNGRYYGLPMDAVLEYKRLRENWIAMRDLSHGADCDLMRPQVLGETYVVRSCNCKMANAKITGG